MKTLIAITLSLALAAATVQAQQTNTPPAKPDCMLCWLVIGAAIVAGGIVIYAYNSGGCCGKHKLVLERDHYDCNWQAIATNITQVCTNKTDVFKDQMSDLCCRYRVKDLGIVP